MVLPSLMILSILLISLGVHSKRPNARRGITIGIVTLIQVAIVVTFLLLAQFPQAN